MELQLIEAAFAQVSSLAQLEEVYDSYCGKQGELSKANKTLASLSPEEKKQAGQEIQRIRQVIQDIYEEKKGVFQRDGYTQKMEQDIVDYSLSYDTLPV